jgi:hypothetical protein
MDHLLRAIDRLVDLSGVRHHLNPSTAASAARQSIPS